MQANLCESWGSRASFNTARGWVELGALLTFILIAMLAR